MADRFNIGLQSRKNIRKENMPKFFASTGPAMDGYLTRKKSGLLIDDLFV